MKKMILLIIVVLMFILVTVAATKISARNDSRASYFELQVKS